MWATAYDWLWTGPCTCEWWRSTTWPSATNIHKSFLFPFLLMTGHEGTYSCPSLFLRMAGQLIRRKKRKGVWTMKWRPFTGTRHSLCSHTHFVPKSRISYFPFSFISLSDPGFARSVLFFLYLCHAGLFKDKKVMAGQWQRL